MLTRNLGNEPDPQLFGRLVKRLSSRVRHHIQRQTESQVWDLVRLQVARNVRVHLLIPTLTAYLPPRKQKP